MTTSFYAAPDAFHDGHVVLPASEARHAARALRKQEGDDIVVVDGEGGWHHVRLEQIGRGKASGQVIETRREVGEPAYDLTVGLALLKNKNRFETFLEKAVELGACRIVPLLTRRTEKEGLKRPRFERILVAAMKQSGRSRLVDLAPPQSLEQVFKTCRAEQALICHEETPLGQSLLEVVRSDFSAASLSVLIGPEGGFAEDEVHRAREAGFQPVSLGKRRLRAETAALTALAGVMLARSA